MKITELLFPAKLIEPIDSYPPFTVVVTTVAINDTVTPGFLFICNNKTSSFFGIKQSRSPVDPAIKFRMIKHPDTSKAIEILLHFGKKMNKRLIFHINPVKKPLRKIFKTALESKIVTFIFYNTKTAHISSTHLVLDDDQIDWFKRNYQEIRRLKTNKSYDSIVDIRKNSFTRKDRVFNEYHTMFFIHEFGKVIKLQGS